MAAEWWEDRREEGLALERAEAGVPVESLDGTLVLSLTRAARLFTTQLNDELLLAGLTGPQWLALHEVVRERSIEPGEIARHLGVARPTASEVLARLIAQRLVTREQAYLDGRLRVYLATDSGVRAAVRGAAGAARATARATDGFTPAERAQLVVLLERVVDSLAGLRPGLQP